MWRSLNQKMKIYLIILSFIIIGTVGIIYKSFADEKPKVVVVLKEVNSEYWKIIKAGSERAFQDFGIEGEVIAPKNGTTEEQLLLLERKLKENPDVLIASPVEPDRVIPILNKFVENGVPTLLVDTDDPWKNKTSYIGTNNIELGKRAGQLLASQLQPGDKVALFGGDVGVRLISERIEGAENSLKEVGIDVVTTINVSDYRNEEKLVKKGMEELLQEHPDLKGVMAVTDTVALHVQDVLKKHGLSIPVTGADGITDMLELIEDGTLSGSVSQNPYDMGYLSVEAAAKAIKGEKVEKNIDSGVDIIVKGNAAQRLKFLKDALEK